MRPLMRRTARVHRSRLEEGRKCTANTPALAA